MVDEFLPRMPPEAARAFTRRRRARNIAILAVLVCLCLLFYAIAMVKLAKG